MDTRYNGQQNFFNWYKVKQSLANIVSFNQLLLFEVFHHGDLFCCYCC